MKRVKWSDGLLRRVAMMNVACRARVGLRRIFHYQEVYDMRPRAIGSCIRVAEAALFVRISP